MSVTTCLNVRGWHLAAGNCKNWGRTQYFAETGKAAFWMYP